MTSILKLMARASVLMIMTSCVNTSLAQKYETVVNGRHLVVHKNPAPVVVHRVLPPYWNKHVTERELHKGKLPRTSLERGRR